MKKLVIVLIVVLFFSSLIKAQSIGKAIAYHNIITNSSGTAYSFGSNFYGQLGNGNSGTNSNVPVDVNTGGVLSGKTITMAAGGTYFSIVLSTDGQVYTFGRNDRGQLGNGNTGTNSNVPVAVITSGVLSGKTITMIAGGDAQSLAVASDGTVYGWGYNAFGNLGDGSYNSTNEPVAVDMSGVLNGKTITSVTTAYRHTIALASDGTVYAWGSNSNGLLGDGSTNSTNVPIAVDMSGALNGKTITAVACGFSHSVALASDGTVYAWGYNGQGQLGTGNNNESHVPVAVNTSGVLNGKTITAIAYGYRHTIALASDGTVYTWGDNSNGQLGNGNTGTNSNVPVTVNTSGVLNGKTITAVACGYYHSIALASDGTVYTWGYNWFGQLGNGNSGTDSNVPVAVDLSSIGALPVELTSFIASSTENGVKLNWTTATEVNNYGFEVESFAQSTKRQAWERIGFVQGYGNSNSPKNYTFVDLNPTSGNVQYRLKLIDYDGQFEYSDVVEVNIEAPVQFSLEQNYPNPFNPTTTVRYSIPTNAVISTGGRNHEDFSSTSSPRNDNVNVTLRVYDMLGKEVATLVNEPQPAGNYEVKFDGNKLASGVYFYQLKAGNYDETKKLLLMK